MRRPQRGGAAVAAGMIKGLFVVAASLSYVAADQDLNRLLETQGPHLANPVAGQFRSNVNKACLDRVLGSPASPQDLPQWALELCSHRYIFVGGFMHTGTGLVRYLIASHPLVHAHIGTGQLEDEGQYLQTVFPVRRSREQRSWALCGCGTCGYQCPRLQDTIITMPDREKLYNEWFGGRSAMVSSAFNLEKSPDFMALMRSRFFPNVSSHAFPIRHPFCNSGDEGGIEVTLSNGKAAVLGPTKQLNYWLRAWHDLITRQMPLLSGELVVVRFESTVGNEDAISQDLWHRLGLPLGNSTLATAAGKVITSTADSEARRAGTETGKYLGNNSAVAAAAAAAQQGSGLQHRKLPFHDAELGMDLAAHSKVNALVWGHDCGPNFEACAKSAECTALWEASKSVTAFFGYSLQEKRVHGARAIWGKKQLAPLAAMHWGLA